MHVIVEWRLLSSRRHKVAPVFTVNCADGACAILALCTPPGTADRRNMSHPTAGARHPASENAMPGMLLMVIDRAVATAAPKGSSR